MLNISIIDTCHRRRLILEGGLVDPWLAKLGKAWNQALIDVGERKLIVDLGHLTGISPTGENALLDLMARGARLCCGLSGGAFGQRAFKELKRRFQLQNVRQWWVP